MIKRERQARTDWYLMEGLVRLDADRLNELEPNKTPVDKFLASDPC